MKTLAIAACLAATISTAFAATPALTGAKYLPQATVSLERARAIALAKEHGTIVDQELEKEAGGNGLRYSFDIKVGAVVHEVGVDAKSGRVLEDTIDNGKD